MKCLNKPWSISVCREVALADLARQQRLRLIWSRKWFRDAIEASTDPSLLNYRLIAQWLGATIPDSRALILALNNSLCFGLYRNGRQIGFARVVTDMAETWVIRNLFISPEYRFVGLGSWLLHCCLSHPGTRGCRHIVAMGEPVPDFFERNGFIACPSLPGIWVTASHDGINDPICARSASSH
ncbi:GNAT family N-acetyltransferase [Pantoea sp. Bo_2]|uniref:GNAT family N-acetyltransferase n=1 Tax=Candidatus Pantoea gossypiicola TaxID=2608008 RepID=A0AB34CLP9_9GAMM|nr:MULTISPECIES: GNAT family N-acetyltransferase [Pantoea]KAA5931627.1 GNAT family N-acetyltransferase [Pantoea sp. VH_8]KAA5936762.1 GNAT family N-acetyltransferase [Pantoea sp. VH_4]KAA5948321.1 GNAT family N-acetyltransferase [Pantoea sp. VH_3]KAA5953591.1 GNAT family N-acetyltransferase [Pantoea sp. VH_25]KAA5956573.1 GNAT family N-acetyltransferase [Pantoea sp. VH_24]